MDDFVRDLLTQWGLKEWIEAFKEQAIDAESLTCLEDEDIDKLIPIIGPRARFKKRLKLFKEEQKTNQEADHAFAKSQQQKEETASQSQVLPSTSYKDVTTEKRKLDLQDKSSRGTPSAKRRLTTNSSSETKILHEVKQIMEDIETKLQHQDDRKLNAFLKTKISDLKMDKRELVGVFGRTGAGKSSLINAVIKEKNLLPSGSIAACTSVMIKVEANMKNQKYEADIEFITEEEWNDELWSMFQFLGDKADHDQDDDEYCDKLSALYGEEWKQMNQKTYEKLKDKKYFKQIPEFIQSKRKILTSETAKGLSEKIAKYTKNDTKQASKEVTRSFWPLVKCVTVRVPHNDFLQYVTLVDLPGNGDCNKSRDTMWKGIVGSCSVIWIVAEINRVTAEKEPWEILKSAASLLGNGGQCQKIHFICTKSDHLEDFEDHSAGAKKILIENRNKVAKEEVGKKFKTQSSLKKYFDEDCFEVLTVSSKEFLNENFLEKQTTEIPRLQMFLQILNDSHSETMNYVSGALGILSLIEGARVGNVAGQNVEVCEDLERNLKVQHDTVSKAMDEAYKAFDKCLIEGVEKSKTNCEEHMKSFLNPLGRNGRGFHKTLKSVVQNGGIYKPKSGTLIDLNMELTSWLTDSIDEEFRKTFPNEGKSGPFNGVISKFSLDIETLKEKYKAVELQMKFLKTEEEKNQKKLSRRICDLKKEIYNSLLETIEENMRDCYKRAAEFTGPDTLLNMRKTLTDHVHSSKDTMFDQAKTVMLEKLRDLQVEILNTLNETMKENIELSLKTDDHSFPVVSAERMKVSELFELMLPG